MHGHRLQGGTPPDRLQAVHHASRDQGMAPSAPVPNLHRCVSACGCAALPIVTCSCHTCALRWRQSLIECGHRIGDLCGEAFTTRDCVHELGPGPFGESCMGLIDNFGLLARPPSPQPPPVWAMRPYFGLDPQLVDLLLMMMIIVVSGLGLRWCVLHMPCPWDDAGPEVGVREGAWSVSSSTSRRSGAKRLEHGGKWKRDRR